MVKEIVQGYRVNYNKTLTKFGKRVYSAEVIFNHNDRIILDDYSLHYLKTKVQNLLPVSVQSRTLVSALCRSQAEYDALT